MMWKSVRIAVLMAVLALTGCTQDNLVGDQDMRSLKRNGNPTVFPDVIDLPPGFQPEGITMGRGTTFFVGSFLGMIYQGDLRTGEGSVLYPPNPFRPALGMNFDSRSGLLWVAGGETGKAFLYRPATGEFVKEYWFKKGFTAVNDVALTDDYAYFTDSFNPVLYRVALENGGQPGTGSFIPLSGDFTQEMICPGFPAPFNANGIVASPDGDQLIIVNSCLGTLYLVHPETGHSTLIDLGGDAVSFGDGLVLKGRILYVVQNILNQVTMIELDPDWASGQIVDVITDPALRIPSTAAAFGNSIYAVNARFDVPSPGPTTEYEVVRLPR